ncbi:RsiV family protein [Halomonas sp. HP20-15]|uniref:RsiV family protein n=1 Tax=Halomonas sp. HP20-15 TaxID=3085901 RepID=UPI0029813205|nr:RsiV family protein [Halomonas sp. HP20-15]MDW5377170.1 RsiV family protein [Halomonas sp. HP20-15]
MTTSLRHAVLLGVGLALYGCQAPGTAGNGDRGIAYEPVEASFTESDCLPARCATVTISALRFPASPALSDRLRRHLLTMALGIDNGEQRPAESWEGFAQAFMAQAEASRRLVPELNAASQARLEASVYARHDDLLIVELDSYVYQTGQAHGLPLTSFMVIDERLGRVVNAEDMLMDGREAAFREALSRAHRRWLQQTGADESFADDWPLSDTLNVAPLEEAWVIHYNVYEIAPYAAGQPELRIPADELTGIVEARYLGD